MWSVDVEEDLHTGKHGGIVLGLRRFEKICDRKKVRPVLFVVGTLVKKHKSLLRRLHRKGWEISCHGYSHSRMDDLSSSEKRKELERCVAVWKKELGFSPKGFRAPQHSIDGETLDLLAELGFRYDSSKTPLNVLQLLFFPSRLGNWLGHFFSWPWRHRIRPGLVERPVVGLGIPPVSLFVRIFPVWLVRAYFGFLGLMFSEVVFYAHSWDFIEMKASGVDRRWSYKLLLRKLEKVMR